MWINMAAFNINFHKANAPLCQKILTKKCYVDVKSFFPFPILPPAPTKSKDLINFPSCL